MVKHLTFTIGKINLLRRRLAIDKVSNKKAEQLNHFFFKEELHTYRIGMKRTLRMARVGR